MLENLLARLDSGQAQEVENQLVEPLGLLIDSLEEPGVDGLVVKGPVHEGFGIGLDGGEWRLELVGCVGDEVLPHPLEPAELGHVVEDEDGPRRRLARQGVAAHREKPVVAALGWIATGQGELSFVSGGNGQAKRRLDGILDLRAADQLRDQTADRGRVETKESVGAGVGEEQAAAEVDGDHGLGHRSQNHEKLLPVLIEPGGPGLDFIRGRVERPDQPADRAPRHGQDRAYFLPRAERLQAAGDLGERRPPAPEHVSGDRRLRLPPRRR